MLQNEGRHLQIKIMAPPNPWPGEQRFGRDSKPLELAQLRS